MNDMAWIENVIMCLHVYSDAPGSLTCEYCKPKRDLIASQLAAAEERGRRRGVEEAAKWMRKPDAAQMLYTLEQKGFLTPRDSALVCDNCKRAQKASDGRTDCDIEIGPCYCAALREAIP